MAMGSPLTFYDEGLPGIDVAPLCGKLIVIEGPDGVGRSTQISMLRPWLEHSGHAVVDTGMARSALVGKTIKQAKLGNTLGPLTLSLFYATDMADRLENEILPALRAGCVVLTDRYIFSSIARAAARGIDVAWIRQIYGFALRPHAIYYLRAGVQNLLPRIVHARGGFDYWESGMDVRLGKDLFESFTRYQARIIRALDRMAQRYGFEIIDASRSPDRIFLDLRKRIGKLLGTPKKARGRKPVRPLSLAAAREAAEEQRLIAAGA
ncbi:MAG TPA: thymidylate kinase [Bryobacterales bacterium]|nr:thymidylate kinase [Bryobacterales bacterium]